MPEPCPAVGRPCAQAGKDNRQVGATLMNQDSSRSHSIFTITIECVEKLTGPNGGAAGRVGQSTLT